MASQVFPDMGSDVSGTLVSKSQCDICRKSFSRPRDVRRHKERVHVLVVTYYYCNMSECFFETTNKAYLREHMGKKHNLRKVPGETVPPGQRAARDAYLRSLEEIKAKGSIGLLQAAAQGSLRLAQLGLEMGADINRIDDRRRSALHIAIAGGHTEVVELLLASTEVEVNGKDYDCRTSLSG
ncbi:hypothetical protein OQA88_2488 [Cercophora sp. LCS_1]